MPTLTPAPLQSPEPTSAPQPDPTAEPASSTFPGAADSLGDAPTAEEYYIAAVSFMDAGDNELAIDLFGKALELDPNFGPAFNDRGPAYTAIGEFTLAEEDLQKAISINPNDPDYHKESGSRAYEHAGFGGRGRQLHVGHRPRTDAG